MERQKTRMAEISALNVFLCMLVIFIHVSSAPVTAYEKSSWQFCVVFLLWRYAGFAVQGFIFLGGLRFFYSKRDGISYRSFYLQRLVKIVVPYIAWSVIYYLCFIYKGYFSFSVRDLALYLLRGNIIAPFYFVITIIQFYALAPLWRFVVRRVNVATALIVSAVITIFLSQYLPSLINAVFRDSGFRYTDRVFTTYLFYWLAGCYAGMYYEQAKNFVKKMRTLIALIFVMLLLLEGILGYISNVGIIRISWLEYVHFLYCIGAILFHAVHHDFREPANKNQGDH